MRRSSFQLLCAFLLALCAPGEAEADFPLPPPATGNVYVSCSSTHLIYSYDATGNFLFSLSHEDLRQPRGLAFAPDGLLYTASQQEDRVLVFDPESREYVRQFTGGGLDGPTGLAFGPDGKLYVSSFGTGKVLVFSDEVYDRVIETEELRWPNCVAFAPNGEIYVVSQYDSHVYHFDAGGKYIKRFTGGDLRSAMGAAIFDGELYVTGGSSHDVVVFDLQGNELREITDGVINGPQGVAFDERGRFVVNSFYTGKVARFTSAGELVEVFDEVGIRVARSAAYRPVTDPRTFVRGDLNGDEIYDIGDAVAVLSRLFLSSGAGGHCPDSGDSDDNGQLDAADALYFLRYLFLNGPEPLQPFPDPGFDPTPDDLACY